MIRQKYLGACLCILLVSISSLVPTGARAEDGRRDLDGIVRLRATAEVGPIGMVVSPSDLWINGRATSGRQVIWGGALLQASAHTSVTVMLDSVSQITLTNGAIVRLSTSAMRLDDHTVRRILIASLISGDIAVKLQPDAAAFIQALGATFTSTNGAQFRAAIRDGEAIIDVASGNVEAEAQTNQRLLITHVETNPANPTGPPIVLDGSLSVLARSTRQIQFRVTDENDKPIPDLPIVLTLATTAGKSIGFFSGGTTTVTLPTNVQGIVDVPFTAGPSPASGSMTARVPGTNASKTINIKVEKRFWTKEKMALTGASVGAILIVTLRPKNGPLEQVPPPGIVP